MSSALSEPTGRHAPSPAVPAPAQDTSVGELVKEASTHLSTLMRSEIELAKIEVTATAKRAGISIALFALAGVVVLFSLTFAFVGLAEGLHAAGFYRWAAYLIVWGILLVIAAIAGLVGFLLIKRLRKPERTLATVKDTAAWAKHPTKAS